LNKFQILLLFLIILDILSPATIGFSKGKQMNTIIHLIKQSKEASLLLGKIDRSLAEKILNDMADSLEKNCGIIFKLNEQDMKNGKAMHLSPQAMGRLHINKERLFKISESARVFAKNDTNLILKDDEGFDIPLASLYAVIYESRPHISAEASIQAFAAGHAIVLRGGKEGFHTNTAIVSILGDVLEDNKLPRALITLIPTTDRVAMTELISLKDQLDYVIPRGSEGLITYIKKNSKITVATQLPKIYYK
jgi:glutamate-5-semialdehyde dehydrogenase